MKSLDSRFEPILTIGTVARKLGVAVQTIRLYEAEGLILPHKTPTGRRMYSLHDLERLQCIRKMIVEHGLNLRGIQQIFALIPCWEYRGGLDEECQKCPVYYHSTGPCWSLPNVSAKCQGQDCRQCPVYRLDISCGTMKEILFGKRHRMPEKAHNN